MIEKDILSSYEFEEIAGLFMAEVIGLSRDFPSLMVDTINKTSADLETNSWVIKKSAEVNKTVMSQKAFQRGLEMDIKSAEEEVVMITIHGLQKKIIREFETLVYESAKHFNGLRINDDDIKDFDGNEGDYRFFSHLDYKFR
ncbi:MAG TPA: hypothetical protein VKC54_00680 [Patescibacteria group bacterium]|nr:hypothetical protein [Patescibacteria group bacterium]